MGNDKMKTFKESAETAGKLLLTNFGETLKGIKKLNKIYQSRNYYKQIK